MFDKYSQKNMLKMLSFGISFMAFSHMHSAANADVPIFALKSGVWVDSPVGHIGNQLAQLIVPQQPVDDIGNEGLGDFQDSVIQPVVLRSVVVEGNQRLTEGRILESMNLQIGEMIDSSMINAGLQRLYRSGLFKDFSADISPDGVLTVKVTENAIINRIAFEGNKALKDELLETVVSSQSRRAYSVSKIDDDVRKIQTAYRQSGRFAAVIRPVIINRPQNRVDVVFEITEGDKTLVESINFIGNSFASDRELRDEMFTKQNNIFSFVFGGDTYDPDKLAFDAENIRNFYLRHGYADFRILSTSSELDADEKGFNITVTMDEGKPYDFGDITVESTIPELSIETLETVVPFVTEDRFNNVLVQDALVNLENSAQAMGVPFVRAAPRVRKNSNENKIDMVFFVEPGPKRYIETININGNVRTLEYVIRRELSIAEGDPVSLKKIQLSESKLLDLQFFKEVSITRRQGTNANDVILDVNVEEKSTGSISIGLGLSTSSGAFATFGISESNFLGKGQKTAATVSIGQKQRNYDLSFTEPRFMDRDLSAGIRLYKTSDDGSADQLYNFDKIGTGVSFDQELFPDWYHHSSVSVSKNEIANVKSTASVIIQDQAGSITKTTLTQSLFYDARNSATKPTKGYRIGGSINATGIIGNYKMLQTSLSGEWYMPFTDSIGLNVNGFVARTTPISGTKVRINDNYLAGGESDIRGFQSSGIGPRVASTGEALGGREKFKGSINLKLPSGLPKHVGVNLIAFIDFGFVRNHGFENKNNLDINSSNSLRVSSGVGVQFDSQVPISILFTKAFKKEKWDKTESVVIRLGTNF